WCLGGRLDRRKPMRFLAGIDSWPEIPVIHGVTALGWSVSSTWFGEKAINTVLDLPLSFVVLALGLALRELFAGLAVLCSGKVKGMTWNRYPTRSVVLSTRDLRDSGRS